MAKRDGVEDTRRKLLEKQKELAKWIKARTEQVGKRAMHGIESAMERHQQGILKATRKWEKTFEAKIEEKMRRIKSVQKRVERASRLMKELDPPAILAEMEALKQKISLKLAADISSMEEVKATHEKLLRSEMGRIESRAGKALDKCSRLVNTNCE